jgi:hypothetical protein
MGRMGLMEHMEHMGRMGRMERDPSERVADEELPCARIRRTI